MNLVRLLRSQTGVTQTTLATLAGTSQPTIASYESGAKSPNLATLQRLAASLGLELIVNFTPTMTREDHRSLAYHRAVAERLRLSSSPAIERAKRVLAKMIKIHPSARALFDRWNVWLDLPVDDLVSKILDPGVMARDMRQVTPFAGLLEARERVQVLKRFRMEHGS